MKIRVELISTLALVTFVSAFLIPSANRLEATNQVRFLAFELGTLGGDNSEAQGINNRGQVVGSADVNTVLGIRHAFLWERGQMTDLGTFGGDGSAAMGINEGGQVVGFASVPPGSGPGHAFLWNNGNLQDLHPNGAIASGARAINNRSQVVGSYTAQDGTEHAALWDGGVMTDLGLPSNPASGALAINDAGQIVGHYRPAPNSFCSFLWDKGRVTTIGQCLSTALSFAFGINNRGDIVGVDPFSFLFRKGVMTSIDLLVPRAINESGNIAGGVFTPARGFRGALWDKGVITEVDTPESEALALNNRSDLAGFSQQNGHNRAYLWTPVH
jgi:probable HAF family extracellular repeat protein